MGWGGFTRGLRPARAVGVKAPHVVQLVDTIVGCSGRGELVGSEAVAGRWLFWLGFVVAVALAGVCAVAGAPLVGVFLGAVVWLAARAAVAPEARAEVDDGLKRACDRLPFCNCGSERSG
jgi:hypothetical protein